MFGSVRSRWGSGYPDLGLVKLVKVYKICGLVHFFVRFLYTLYAFYYTFVHSMMLTDPLVILTLLRFVHFIVHLLIPTRLTMLLVRFFVHFCTLNDGY